MIAPVSCENPSPFPLGITDVYLEAGESVISEGMGRETIFAPFTREPVRELVLTGNVRNQGLYPITQLDIAIRNPMFLPDHVVKLMFCRERHDENDKWWERVSRNLLLEPQAEFTFDASFHLPDRDGDLELINHLSDFRLHVIGIKYVTKKGRVDQWWDEINTKWLMRGVITASTAGASPDGLDNLEISVMYVDSPRGLNEE
jgi:hypothetical protein